MAYSERIAVFGIFPDRGAAERAVDALMQVGFPAADLSMRPSVESSTREMTIASVLVSANCETSDEITTAKAVMRQTGGDDIASAAEGQGEVQGENDRPEDTDYRTTQL